MARTKKKSKKAAAGSRKRTVAKARTKSKAKTRRPITKRKAAKKKAVKRARVKEKAPKRKVAKPKARAATKSKAHAAAKSKDKRILDLAQVIRSKNAGPFEITFDIMFDSAKNYHIVRDSGVITRKLISRLYGISDNAVLVCRPYDPAQAIKITIRRQISSGDIGDSDVYGCQQHMPLTSIVVPVS